MGHFINRSETATKVADLIGSEDGRQHLAQYGWSKGMPVVMAQPADSFDDVIALASIHGRAVLLAMLDPVSKQLHLIHISEPNPALQVVDPPSPEAIIRVLFDEVLKSSLVTFRVKHWKYSAVAHYVPSYQPKRDGVSRLYRNKLMSN